MKAAYITRTGPPDVIEYGDLADPEPAAGQVLVRVAAVAVNPIDTYIRGGMVDVSLEFPYIIGCDLAGTVEACGEGVTRFAVGDRVWGTNQGLLGRPGTFSELAAVDEQWLYATPDSLGDAAAVAGSLVGITAHLGLFRNARLEAGQTVFVNGGTGGVGSCVVQLAVAAGARVIATVGNAEKQALCESWGADLVLDYHDPGLDQAIGGFAEAGGGIDVWYETLREPTPDRTVELMAKRGRIVVIAGRAARPEFPIGPFYVKDLQLVGFAMFNASHAEQRECAEAINKLADEDGWHPNIGRTLPLADAAAAHRLQEENTLESQGTLSGKIVLEV